ncbi:DUF1772 domain-containing protein, partial [Actinomadura adrarensis]
RARARGPRFRGVRARHRRDGGLGGSVMKTLSMVVAAVSLLMAAGMAGIFFAFSNSVMPGLNAARPTSAIETMQTINDKIQNPLFLLTFVGVPVAAAVAGGLLLASGERSAALLFFAAAAVYVLGSFLPTAVVNVPLNNTLDGTAIPSDLEEAGRIWTDYSSRWTPWNHLRAVASGVSVLLIGAGLYVFGRNGAGS